MLCYSKDGLYTSLTTLPSEALQTEALKLFKVKREQSAGPPTGAPSQWARLSPEQFAHRGDAGVEPVQVGVAHRGI